MTLSNKKVLVWDRGLYAALGQKLGESFSKAFYYLPQSDPYPKSPASQIGEGLPEMERVDNFWKYLDKVDLVFFPDCYDGDLQKWLRAKGYRVFGAGPSEIIELDKWRFINVLKAVGLPCPPTERIIGLDALEKHLAGVEGEKWLKTSYFRGDYETKKYRGMDHLQSWLEDLRSRIGRVAEGIEILVQDPVDASVEVGFDGFQVDGNYVTEDCLIGYEIKDKGYIGKIFQDVPLKLQAVNYKMAPAFKKLGYRGHYSTEVRIDKSGKPFFIDPTCRAPSPPSELMCELYENYADIVWSISGGEIPKLKPRSEYGAEIILISDWHEDHELCVEFPKDIYPFVKLKNQALRDGKHYCIPHDNSGFFGAVIAYGDTTEEATKLCMERAEQIKCEGLQLDKTIFDEVQEQIKGGQRWGINWKSNIGTKLPTLEGTIS